MCVRRAEAAAGGHQGVTAAKAHLTDRSSRSKDGVGARLEPYHHGGPHTELKPNPNEIKVEQQEIWNKTSASIVPGTEL